MGVRDGELIRHQGWPGGVNNVQPETSVPDGQLRAGVNVDLDDAGKPRRRTGYVQVLAGDVHSLYAAHGYLYAVADGDLSAIDDNLQLTPIYSGAGALAVSYAETPNALYWSNGSVIRRIDNGLVDRPVWPSCPGQPTVSAAASGGLDAGCYQVAITYRDADGRESGSSLATVVDLTQGQGIQLSNIPANPEAQWCRVYVTNANGDVLYHAADIPAGTASWTFGVGQRGKALETQFLVPLPPGHILTQWNGRLFSAGGRYLRWSQPMRYGLHHRDDYIAYADRIAMFAPMGEGTNAGAFIAVNTEKTQRTYWMPGGDPKQWQMTIASHYGVVPGSMQLVSGALLGLEYSGYVPYWLDTAGVFCAGLPGGQILRITQDRFMAPEGAERAATLLREQNGYSQLLMSVLGGGIARGRATDEVTATIRRNGVTT